MGYPRFGKPKFDSRQHTETVNRQISRISRILRFFFRFFAGCYPLSISFGNNCFYYTKGFPLKTSVGRGSFELPCLKTHYIANIQLVFHQIPLKSFFWQSISISGQLSWKSFVHCYVQLQRYTSIFHSHSVKPPLRSSTFWKPGDIPLIFQIVSYQFSKTNGIFMAATLLILMEYP